MSTATPSIVSVLVNVCFGILASSRNYRAFILMDYVVSVILSFHLDQFSGNGGHATHYATQTMQ